MYTLQLTVSDIEALPNFRKRTASGEYSSACPVCGGDPQMDTDRFRFWVDKGNYWCRRCDVKGFVVTDSENSGYSSSAWYKKVEELRLRQDALERDRRAATIAAISSVKQSQLDAEYHLNLMESPEMVGYVTRNWGLSLEQMQKYMLGYSRSCPTYNASDSITIPVYYNGDLFNIRHRLLRINSDSGKYRPQVKGIPPALFNCDSLMESDEAIIVEGEIKSIIVGDIVDIPVVGTPGAQIFKDKWVRFFDGLKRVFVVLDPGTDSESKKVAGIIGRVVKDVRIIDMPVKPDDFFVKYSGTKRQFENYLMYSRRTVVA